MSRLTKKSVIIPEGITVAEAAGRLRVKGPKGELAENILSDITVTLGEHELMVTPKGDSKRARMNAGTVWSLVQNAIVGVKEGFTKVLEIEGVGYKAAIDGKDLLLSLGYVNPVRYSPPAGVTIAVEKNQITVSGIHKESVGRAAAEIRNFKKPEPYKGKGIHYRGEVVRRKAGKKATTTGSA